LRAEPEPGSYQASSLAVTLMAPVGDSTAAVQYATDGLIPDEEAAAFTGAVTVQLAEPGNHVITCRVVDASGRRHYNTFPYTLRE